MSTTVSPPISPHTDLIQSLHAAEGEAVIERAMAQLSRGGDVPLLVATADALARIGLACFGERLLRSVSGAALHPSVVAAGAELQTTPSNTVEAETLHANFVRNKAALSDRLPHVRHALATMAFPGDRFVVCRAHSGNMHALRGSSQRLETVFPIADHARVATAAHLPPLDLASSLVAAGVPSAAMLARLSALSVGAYRPPLDIIETDAEVFALWLGMLANESLLRDARVGCFVGPQAADAYADFIAQTPGRVPATCVMTNHRQGWMPPRIDASLLRSIGDRVRTRQVQLRVKTQRRHIATRPDAWREMFADAARRNRRLNIVGFTSRYSTVIQHAMRDLAAAFRRLGHDFHIATQPDDCSASIDVAGTLCERDVDLIVAINHLRFEYPDSIPNNVPFVAWTQDHMDHLWSHTAGASVGELDLVIAHAPDVLAGLYGYRRDRVLASSNLTDPHTYSKEALPGSELAPHRCDVSFVSHGAATPEALVEEIARATTPAFGHLLQTFMRLARERMADEGCLHAQRLVEVMLQAEAESGHPPLSASVRRATVYPQVARIHDRLFRHETLAWAAQWARQRRRTLRLYGRGWEHHPTLGEFAAGEVASGRALRATYQASAINLQANAYASLHQRLLDGVASGGFVLSRWNPADFVREPFLELQRAIQERRLQTLAQIVRLREGDAAFDRACAEAERLSGLVIRACDDARWREQRRVQQAGNPIEALQNDDGVFEMLRDLRYLPARTAGSLPGFERTVFRTQQEMHRLLDQFSESPERRRAIIEPMREAIVRHDTFDALAVRIMQAFACGGVPR